MPELLFKGKEFVFNHHLAVPHRPLVPDAVRSVGEPRLDGNLVIHGDNLHALKSLLPMYAGKIDCIFIDPPYNTGNEGWCYNDNVNSPMMQQWLSENPVGIEDGLRHDKSITKPFRDASAVCINCFTCMRVKRCAFGKYQSSKSCHSLTTP